MRDRQLQTFVTEFDVLFDRFLGNMPATSGVPAEFERMWAFDFEDKEKEVVIRADAPGFELKDFNITMTGHRLTILAERKEETRELTFERLVAVPEDVDPKKIEAVYRNGVLEIKMPKLPSAETRRIEVKP